MNNLFRSPEDRDDELLSAYLDNALPPGERLKLEARLAVDAKLRRTLNELRAVKGGLADLPKVKPPRNFTLTPAMAGRPASRPVSPLIPALNWATAVAAILFVAVASLDLLRAPQVTAPQTAAQALTTQAEAPAEVAPQVALAPEASLKSATATPEDGSRIFADASPEATGPQPESGGVGETEPYGYSEAEPLTGGPGGGGAGGGAIPESAGTPIPPLANSAAVPSETTTPAGTEVASQTTDQTATLAPEVALADAAPAPAVDTQAANVPTPSEGLSTLRLTQIGLGLALIALITASFILRRR
jgi:hypothetical protein